MRAEAIVYIYKVFFSFAHANQLRIGSAYTFKFANWNVPTVPCRGASRASKSAKRSQLIRTFIADFMQIIATHSQSTSAVKGQIGLSNSVRVLKSCMRVIHFPYLIAHGRDRKKHQRKRRRNHITLSEIPSLSKREATAWKWKYQVSAALSNEVNELKRKRESSLSQRVNNKSDWLCHRSCSLPF